METSASSEKRVTIKDRDMKTDGGSELQVGHDTDRYIRYVFFACGSETLIAVTFWDVLQIGDCFSLRA
jgi:hypothetical protein